MASWIGDPHGPGQGGGSGPADTDPGWRHPYESLYRSAAGEAPYPTRPTPRHFEPHLSRPDGAEEGFGWLYRTDPTSADPAATAPPPETRLAETRVRSGSAVLLPALAPTPTARPRRRGVVLVLVLLVLALVGISLAAELTGVIPALSPAGGEANAIVSRILGTRS